MAVSLILDLIIAAIIVLCIFLSAKHGFMRTLIEVAGFVAALFLAFTVSSPLADITYDKVIEPSIIEKVEVASAEEGAKVSNKLWDSLPGIIKKYSSGMGVSKESFTKKVDSSVSGSIAGSAAKISKNVTKPIITKVLTAIYSLVISILLIIIFKILAKLINKLFSFSLVGKINAMLGGVVGIAKGVAIAFVFCMIISVLITFSKGGFWIFTPDNISRTYLFKLLYEFSPLA